MTSRDGDGERAARAAFADHRGDDRRAQAGHLVEVAADGLGLAALLRADARVRARRVDEREERQLELLGELHEAQRLAIALGPRHAEVAVDLLLGVAALLVAEHHAGLAVEAREAADDRRVVGVRAVAVQLAELAEHAVDVVERVRPLRMARDLRDLPRRELGVDVARELLALLREARDLVGDVDRGVLVDVAQLVDLLLQLGDRLLEIEEGLFHGRRIIA